MSKPTSIFFDEKAQTWSKKYLPQGPLRNRIDAFTSALSHSGQANRQVLDFGCGTGELARSMAEAGFFVTAADIAPNMIAKAKEARPCGVEWVLLQPDETALPFKTAGFDVIVASSVLEYVDDPAATLAELGRLLAPGGVLLATVPDMASVTRKLESTAADSQVVASLLSRLGRRTRRYLRYLELSKNRLGLDRWSSLANDAGLVVHNATTFNQFWLLELHRGMGGPKRLGTLAPLPSRREGFPGITVIIPTLNEELNLGAALDSVRGWATEVFVVDSFSADGTLDLALGRPAQERVQVVQHRFLDYGAQWNWALDVLPIRTEWVLKLDADERVPEAFKDEFEALASVTDTPYAAYYFRRRIFFLGKALRWGGTNGNWDIRVWKHRHARFEKRSVNEHLIVRGGPVGFMRSKVEHHDSKDFSTWLTKQNRYSSMEARIRIERENVTTVARLFGSKHERTNWLREVYFRVPFRNLLMFLYTAVLRGGFLDGATGIRYALVRSMIRFWNDLKVAEFRKTGRMPSVERPSTGLAHPVVAASELQRLVDSRRVPNELAPGVEFNWRYPL
jgi:2-polyprenyl-3-methyl-5-hydroxy-6-metoxy-1,4-benzoquinol methylase/glycosyltransferase involved in cell wall biosynthesis